MLAQSARIVPSFAGSLCVAFVLTTTSCGAKSGTGDGPVISVSTGVASFVPESSISSGGFEDTGHTCILVAGGRVKC